MEDCWIIIIFDNIHLFCQDTDSDVDTVILEVPSSSSPRACEVPELERTESTFVSSTHSISVCLSVVCTLI